MFFVLRVPDIQKSVLKLVDKRRLGEEKNNVIKIKMNSQLTPTGSRISVP